jgi:hypothetical protein
MVTQSDIKPAIVGVIGGAVLLAIIGFTWGGWSTKATADTAANKLAASSVVMALAPICLNQFQKSPDMAMKQANFMKLSAGERGSFVEKGGWAMMPGATTTDRKVADACGELIASNKS